MTVTVTQKPHSHQLELIIENLPPQGLLPCSHQHGSSVL